MRAHGVFRGVTRSVLLALLGWLLLAGSIVAVPGGVSDASAGFQVMPPVPGGGGGGTDFWNAQQPNFVTYPPHNMNQVTRLESFLGIAPSHMARPAQGNFGNMSWFLLPVRSRYQFTQRDTGRLEVVTCRGFGEPFGPVVSSSPQFCGQDWQHSSAVDGYWDLRARQHFVGIARIDLLFSSAAFPVTTWGPWSRPERLAVGEVLTYVAEDRGPSELAAVHLATTRGAFQPRVNNSDFFLTEFYPAATTTLDGGGADTDHATTGETPELPEMRPFPPYVPEMRPFPPYRPADPEPVVPELQPGEFIPWSEFDPEPVVPELEPGEFIPWSDVEEGEIVPGRAPITVPPQFPVRPPQVPVQPPTVPVKPPSQLPVPAPGPLPIPIPGRPLPIPAPGPVPIPIPECPRIPGVGNPQVFGQAGAEAEVDFKITRRDDETTAVTVSGEVVVDAGVNGLHSVIDESLLPPHIKETLKQELPDDVNGSGSVRQTNEFIISDDFELVSARVIFEIQFGATVWRISIDIDGRTVTEGLGKIDPCDLKTFNPFRIVGPVEVVVQKYTRTTTDWGGGGAFGVSLSGELTNTEDVADGQPNVFHITTDPSGRPIKVPGPVPRDPDDRPEGEGPWPDPHVLPSTASTCTLDGSVGVEIPYILNGSVEGEWVFVLEEMSDGRMRGHRGQIGGISGGVGGGAGGGVDIGDEVFGGEAGWEGRLGGAVGWNKTWDLPKGTTMEEFLREAIIDIVVPAELPGRIPEWVRDRLGCEMEPASEIGVILRVRANAGAQATSSDPVQPLLPALIQPPGNAQPAAEPDDEPDLTGDEQAELFPHDQAEFFPHDDGPPRVQLVKPDAGPADPDGLREEDLEKHFEEHQKAGGTRANWFDKLSLEQVETIMALPSKHRLRKRLLNNGGLRAGGEHEFFPVSRAAKLKQLGFTADEIRSIAVPTKDFIAWLPPEKAGDPPLDPPVPIKHAWKGHGVTYHKALFEKIDNAKTAEEAAKGVVEVNKEWNVGTLPGAKKMKPEKIIEARDNNQIEPFTDLDPDDFKGRMPLGDP